MERITIYCGIYEGVYEWLEKEGHRVTFSMDKHTKIDSINVIDDKSFAKVYLKLHRDYVLYLDKKRSERWTV